MEELFFMIATMLGVTIALWAIYFVIKKKTDAENNAQPVKCEKVKIIDMQRINAGDIVFGEIWVMFETEDGQRMRLNAKPQNTLMIGDEGLMTWQGRKIIKFDRNKVVG